MIILNVRVDIKYFYTPKNVTVIASRSNGHRHRGNNNNDKNKRKHNFIRCNRCWIARKRL